jgi:hypothetical protein
MGQTGRKIRDAAGLTGRLECERYRYYGAHERGSLSVD